MEVSLPIVRGRVCAQDRKQVCNNFAIQYGVYQIRAGLHPIWAGVHLIWAEVHAICSAVRVITVSS